MACQGAVKSCSELKHWTFFSLSSSKAWCELGWPLLPGCAGTFLISHHWGSLNICQTSSIGQHYLMLSRKVAKQTGCLSPCLLLILGKYEPWVRDSVLVVASDSTMAWRRGKTLQGRGWQPVLTWECWRWPGWVLGGETCVKRKICCARDPLTEAEYWPVEQIKSFQECPNK